MRVPNEKLRLVSPVDPRSGTVSTSRARARSGRAASELRTEVLSLVYRQMVALAGYPQDLDDLVQNAAEQVFRSLPSFEGQSAPATWTYRICYHTLLKHWRWHRRWLARFTLTDDPENESRSPIAHGSGDGAALLEARERARRLRAALERVSAKRRVVVILHDLEELEIEEISAIVGANERTVRSRLRDGRRRLAEELERDPYFGDEACKLEEP